MSNLFQKKCEPCSGATSKLSINEINNKLLEIDNWELNNNQEMIFKKFKFKSFKKALYFTNLVGELAEEEGHHPDISFGWGYVDVAIYTHKISGLHENDFIMATKIGILYPD